MKICNWDVETCATVDLAVAGAYIYAAHPNTDLLTISYTFDQGATMKRWRVWLGEPMPKDLDDALNDPDCIFEGWNANFERLICRHVLKREIPIRRFRCTMARARSMALPGKLELAAKALKIPEQKADKSIMMKWCKPLPNGQWAEDEKEYEQLCDYCDDDVRAEIGVGMLLRDLSEEEWEDYWINEEINDRGLPLDMDLVRAAQRYAADETAEINARISMLTRGEVTTVKQHLRIKKWIMPRLPEGYELKPRKGKLSFDRNVREFYLSVENEDVITGDIREFIQLVHDGGRASTAKFAAMQARTGPDDRLRGAYVFNGAGQTGRFSSTGAQTHNFIRKKLVNIENVVERILGGAPKGDIIKAASYDVNGALVFDDGEQIKKPYDMLTIMSRTLRPSIVAPLKKKLVWGDWSSIEAIVLPWLSKENSASRVLELYAAGEDLYRYQALDTFNLQSLDQVTKDQRQACKVQILSLGFGGGVGAFQAMARNYGLRVDDATADGYKVSWRLSNPWAQRFWNALETAAFNAVRQPETVFEAGRVAYFFAQGSLWCMLPSGRMLCYPFAELETVEDRFGSSLKVTAIKGSFHPAADSDDWPRMTLWGGIQAENCLTAETEILTTSGWKRIVDVLLTDKVWDGVEWVRHEGLVAKGLRGVMDFGGVGITPDHRVLTAAGWLRAEDTTHETATASQGFDWPDVRSLDGGTVRRGDIEPDGVRPPQGDMAVSLRLRPDERTNRSGGNTRQDQQLRMSSCGNRTRSKDTRNDRAPGVLGLAFNARSLSTAISSGLSKLWRARHSGMPSLAQVREFLVGYGSDVSSWFNARASGQFERLQPGQLRLADTYGASAQHTRQSVYRHAERANVVMRRSSDQRHSTRHDRVSSGCGMASVRSFREAEVYDLKNAGPRHRFTIRGTDGRPFIVHNCTQAEAASLLRGAVRESVACGWDQIGHTHDELLWEIDEHEEEHAKAAMLDIMTTTPAWAAGLPLRAEIKSGAVYGV